MSEQTADTGNLDQENEIDRETPTGQFMLSKRDISRIKRIGTWHGAAVFAALGLFGATNFWAMSSGLALAHVVAIGNAFVAAIALSGIFHEWGHFTGAKVAGSIAPVLKNPARLYFFFNFDMAQNSVSQFISLSLGGIIANWVLALLILITIPISSLAAATLLAVAVARAVNVAFFEVPIVLRVKESGEPQKELDHQLENYGLRQLPGVIAGAFVFLAFT